MSSERSIQFQKKHVKLRNMIHLSAVTKDPVKVGEFLVGGFAGGPPADVA